MPSSLSRGASAMSVLSPVRRCLSLKFALKFGFYDYKNKYQAGMADEFCPADLKPEITEKLKRTAERVYEVLMFDVYGRMDFIVDDH